MMPSATSFIDANSMTAAELGALLNRLSKNEEEYDEYMSFKQQPLSEAFRNITMMSYAHPTVLCRLCDFADNFRKIHGPMSRKPRGRKGKKQGGAKQG
jgi:Glycosyltransferase family 10 (fucosyltransferase) C-term